MQDQFNLSANAIWVKLDPKDFPTNCICQKGVQPVRNPLSLSLCVALFDWKTSDLSISRWAEKAIFQPMFSSVIPLPHSWIVGRRGCCLPANSVSECVFLCVLPNNLAVRQSSFSNLYVQVVHVLLTRTLFPAKLANGTDVISHESLKEKHNIFQRETQLPSHPFPWRFWRVPEDTLSGWRFTRHPK